MTLTTDTVSGLAPDQASLKAASKLTKAAKWPLREVDAASNLVWGECQGSGANPYRTVFDLSDHGYKCTCPSRKFPCKHALALMWMYAENPNDFTPGTVPEWVTDWLGRRRNTGKKPETSTEGKNIALARAAEPEKPEDPKAIARREAATQKRAAQTEAARLGALDELETWITDQLQNGLGALLNDLPPRCRAIAARMIDGKANGLAGLLDEIPARVMALPGDERLDALIGQLSQLVILARAYRATPKAPDIHRAIATSETREAVLEHPDALRIKSLWEVAGERIVTRRDDLVSQSTWLMNLRDTGPRFALLLDFFPASLGRRGSAFASGEQFEAELVFYPGSTPLRALVANRAPCPATPWPTAQAQPLMAAASAAQSPWREEAPLLLPEGRIAQSRKGDPWWVASDGTLSLPMEQTPPPALEGMVLTTATAIWDGTRLSILSAQTPWGRVALDG